MYRKVRITKNQRRGRSGEHEIESRLSSFSNIMHPEHDLGIDYICELIENDTLSNKHFGVQAKSTKEFKNDYISHIKKTTLLLWLSRRFPVYLIVNERFSGNCYWTSIQDIRQLLIDKLRVNSKTVNIKVNRTNSLETDDNTSFVEKIKSDNVRVSASHGIPEFISEGGYVGTIPAQLLTDEMKVMTKEKIRQGFDYLIYDHLLRNDPTSAYPLSLMLTQFDLGHYDHFLIHARICRRLEKYEEAERFYDTAIELCKSDPNWNLRKLPNDPSIEDIIMMLENEKAKFKQNPRMD